MAVLKVARLGHPVLRAGARPLAAEEVASRDIQRFIDDMVETMRDYNGVGLAAVQVHVAIQIAVLEVNDNPRYPEKPAVPLSVLINPRIEPLSQETEEDWEAIIVDDESTDDTYTQALPFLGKGDKIRYVRKTHSGEAFSKNRGIELSRGRFISFLDSDDEYAPDHLESRRKILELNPAVAFLYGGVRIIGSSQVPDRRDHDGSARDRRVAADRPRSVPRGDGRGAPMNEERDDQRGKEPAPDLQRRTIFTLGCVGFGAATLGYGM